MDGIGDLWAALVACFQRKDGEPNLASDDKTNTLCIYLTQRKK